MTNFTMFINALGSVDIIFFIICAVIIALIVGVYFLIPVINKKYYQEQRDNLKMREAAFKSNATKKQTNISAAEDVSADETKKDEHNT